jgi:hypothetical protein
MIALLPAALIVALAAAPAFGQGAPAGAPPAGAPPTGAPGAQAQGDGTIIQRRQQPRQRTGTPTEQLFEAINTGDLEDVRAAVAAGGDVSARNVLGLTPIDLAIDLGRTDIALYLLSLGRVRPLTALPEERAARPRGPTREEILRQQRAEEAAIEAALRARGAAPPVSPQGVVPVAPLWRGDGGAPNPAIGFLGFDAGRPPGAQAPAGTRAAPASRPPAPGRSPVTREPLPPG